MTTAERDALRTALARMMTAFQSNSTMRFYIQTWMDDVLAASGDNNHASEYNTGQTAGPMLICTFAGLPAAPTVGDLAIITDSGQAPNGTTAAAGGINPKLVKCSSTGPSVWQIQ